MNMDRNLIIFVHVFVILFVSEPTTAGKFTRTDYVYNQKSRSYYKLHIESTRITQAKAICAMEGASLMIPTSKEDVRIVHAMLKKLPDIGNYVWVGNDGENHESAEEEPIIDLSVSSSERNLLNAQSCDVITRSSEIETYACWRRLPFVCKVEEKDVFYDDKCGVNVPGYTHLNEIGSCYKVPNIALTWDGAYDECQNEGAHLLVVNSDAESLALKDFLNGAPRIESAVATYFFFAGFRANKPTDSSQRVFRTIFNQTLDEAGFNKWSEGEPNNHENSEYCGTIFKNNGLFNDVNCADLFGFVCEKEVHA